jgi:hypothetical protein
MKFRSAPKGKLVLTMLQRGMWLVNQQFWISIEVRKCVCYRRSRSIISRANSSEVAFSLRIRTSASDR